MKPYYEDDYVTLFHGDCLDVPGWDGADLLLTDPPYGRNWRQGRMYNRGDARTGIAGDKDTSIRDAVLERWGRGKPAIVFGDLMLQPPAGTKLTAIYAKPADAGMRGAISGIRRDAEAIYLVGPWRAGLGGRSSIFTTRSPMVGSRSGISARSGGHPHAKPLDLLAELIDIAKPECIADPFAGSGSVLVAAKQFGKSAIGVEIEEKYCEMAAKRLAIDALPLW